MEPRHRPRSGLRALLAIAALGSVIVAACGGTTSASPTAGPVTVDSVEAAARVAAAASPLFGGIGPRDPNLIGQAAWWEGVPLDPSAGRPGWQVTFRVGWGDCPSGCIDEHRWTFDVTTDGKVRFTSESGPELPADVQASLRTTATATGVAGRVVAGPTCPVERPGDPACNARTVAGAVLVVTGAGGTEVARFTTDASGLFRIGLQPGDYTLEPQPVEGLMGTPGPMPFTVANGSETYLDVSYDTGIR